MHQGSVTEAHLSLRRMNVDIDFFRIAIQKQQCEGETRRRHQVVIRRRYSVQKQPVPDQSSVDEQINRISIQLLDLRAADKSTQTEPPLQGLFALFRGKRQVAPMIAQIQQIVQDLASKDLKHALPQ